MERWERRERKLRRRREAMRVSGMSLKKVLLPLLRQKAEKSERAAAARRRPSVRSGSRTAHPALPGDQPLAGSLRRQL